jgi:Zn finger protein HypA/HybF involved in hydrogenase expression
MENTDKYTIKCNKCDWEGTEEELKVFVDLSDNEISHDIQYIKGCPECENDSFLMDIN